MTIPSSRYRIIRVARGNGTFAMTSRSAKAAPSVHGDPYDTRNRRRDLPSASAISATSALSGSSTAFAGSVVRNPGSRSSRLSGCRTPVTVRYCVAPCGRVMSDPQTAEENVPQGDARPPGGARAPGCVAAVAHQLAASGRDERVGGHVEADVLGTARQAPVDVVPEVRAARGVVDAERVGDLVRERAAQ